MHHATARFWTWFGHLPESVQFIAEKNFELLKTNPSHPSLHFKKVGKLWSVRVGMDHRALAVKEGENFIWVWIGDDDEYARMVKQQSQTNELQRIHGEQIKGRAFRAMVSAD